MSKMPTFPQAYHDFNKSNGADTLVFTEGPSLTRQEFLEECDINTLMKKYDMHVHGGPGGLSPLVPQYADFTQVPGTLLEYMEFMKMAEGQFMSLPALVRKEFDNSATDFVAFASDPGNLDQMREWGLAPPAETPKAPLEVRVVQDDPSAASAAPSSAGGAPGAAPTHVST